MDRLGFEGQVMASNVGWDGQQLGVCQLPAQLKRLSERACRIPSRQLMTAAAVTGLLFEVMPARADCHGLPRMRVPAAVRIELGPGPDPRVPVDMTQPPWSALGRVHNEALGGWCTGTLVGPRTLLTAAHCTVSYRTGCFLQPSSLHFVLDYERGSHRGHAQVASFKVARGYELGAGPSGADWALLTLETPLASAARTLRLADPADGLPEALEGYPAAVAGY
jgi:hypothetical protein